MLAVGLTEPAIALVGVGAVCIFVGAAMLAPAVARPLSGVIGRPLARVFGEAGKLGRQNSMRSPRRTAQTASALMVGIALVSAIAVFGASVSKSATASVKEAISADLLISASSGGLADSVPALAAAVPGVTNRPLSTGTSSSSRARSKPSPRPRRTTCRTPSSCG